MKRIVDALMGVQIGEPMVHRNLTVFPLIGGSAGPADYLTLDEALQRKCVVITEVSQGGSVPELKFINSGVDSVREARVMAETWFDDKMKRITALYTQQTRLISFALAFVISVALGIDSIALTVHLWQEPSTRALLAQKADLIVQEQGLQANTEDLANDLQALNIPMFWWSDPPSTTRGWIVKVIGTIITGFAAGLGAPFWYQILKQVRPGASPSKSTA